MGDRYVVVPRSIAVLCRDLVAGDNDRDDALSIARELQGQLGPFVSELEAAGAMEREERARALRRELRRAEQP